MIAAAAEAFVAVPENMLHYNRGRKSGEQAAKDTAKSTAFAAGVGFATAGVAKGAALAGIGLSLGPFGTPLMIAGGLVFVGSAINRIANAAERDLPLDRTPNLFLRRTSGARPCLPEMSPGLPVIQHDWSFKRLSILISIPMDSQASLIGLIMNRTRAREYWSKSTLMKPPGGVKRIVCLANSWKPSGRCIAGKEILSDGRRGAWIRPVSDGDNGGVSTSDSRYADGSTPRLLDVMNVPVLTPQPKDHQRENWLLDPTRRWSKVGTVGLADLAKWADEVDTLWINNDSSGTGLYNRVHTSLASSINSSLCLIRVSLQVCVFNYYNRRIAQGRFRYRGTEYSLRITDPDYEQICEIQSDGCYEIGECFMTVSLAGAYNDEYCYKLIAAIIKP